MENILKSSRRRLVLHLVSRRLQTHFSAVHSSHVGTDLSAKYVAYKHPMEWNTADLPPEQKLNMVRVRLAVISSMPTIGSVGGGISVIHNCDIFHVPMKNISYSISARGSVRGRRPII